MNEIGTNIEYWVEFGVNLFCWMIRFMHQEWMILVQGHLRVALRIHLRYTDHVRTKSATCIYTGMDTMVGSPRKWLYMDITQRLLHFTTTLTFLMVFGMASIIVIRLHLCNVGGILADKKMKKSRGTCEPLLLLGSVFQSLFWFHFTVWW